MYSLSISSLWHLAYTEHRSTTTACYKETRLPESVLQCLALNAPLLNCCRDDFEVQSHVQAASQQVVGAVAMPTANMFLNLWSHSQSVFQDPGPFSGTGK